MEEEKGITWGVTTVSYKVNWHCFKELSFYLSLLVMLIWIAPVFTATSILEFYFCLACLLLGIYFTAKIVVKKV